MPEKINESTGNNCDASVINRIMAINPAFEVVVVPTYPAQGSETIDFKFDHIVICSLERIEFDYKLFEALDLIDITDVTDYPQERSIVFIDASHKLPDDFFYYLVNRARTLLSIVNSICNKYGRFEKCATSYKDLISTLAFINKHSDKFNCYQNTKFILVKRYTCPDPDVFLDMVIVHDTSVVPVPKPIPIIDNPYYKVWD